MTIVPVDVSGDVFERESFYNSIPWKAVGPLVISFNQSQMTISVFIGFKIIELTDKIINIFCLLFNSFYTRQ